MSSTTPKPSKAERRDQAREQARQLREQQQKRERRSRILAISGLSAAVIALIVVIALILGNRPEPAAGVVYTGDDAETLTLADVTAPSTTESNGAIPVRADGVAGEPAEDGDVVVLVYFDYMCPYCGKFEAANDSELKTLREAGGVTVEYHIISFLDGQSAGGQYSTRAANASAVVADGAPEAWSDFHSALFESEPTEGTQGLSDKELADIATDAGVPQDVVDRFTVAADDGDWRIFAPWVVANTNTAATDLGKLSTPTVLIDGEQFTGDMYTAGPLTAAVEAAKG